MQSDSYLIYDFFIKKVLDKINIMYYYIKEEKNERCREKDKE